MAWRVGAGDRGILLLLPGECIPVSEFTTALDPSRIGCRPISETQRRDRATPCCPWEDSVKFEKLTFRSVTVRSVLIPLRRPIVSKVGLFDQWPVILIDLATEQGIVGRSYLEPYLKHAARYIVPAIHDLAASRKGQPIRPIEDFQNGRRALNLIGYEGVSMIAVS